MVEILVLRTYAPTGTNGDLSINGKQLCHSIELPWKDNKQRESCIPENTYEVAKHYSEHLGWCLAIKNVPGRDAILIHAANDAMKELLGCMAPVTNLTGAGKGESSKVQLEAIKAQVYPALEKGEKVTITFRKK